MTYKNFTNILFILQIKQLEQLITYSTVIIQTIILRVYMEISKLTEMYKYKSCVYIYKTFFQNHDSVLHSKLSIQTDVHAHNTRYDNKLSLVHCNRSMTQHSIYYSGVKIFNSMPTEMYRNKSLSIFKNNCASTI